MKLHLCIDCKPDGSVFVGYGPALHGSVQRSREVGGFSYGTSVGDEAVRYAIVSAAAAIAKSHD